MRILVTGGTGFLGSNLCKALVDNGDTVACLDNNYTGRLENIKELLDKPNFTFIEKDVTGPLKVKGKIDQIYNLACPASPPAYQGKHAIETTRTCVLGALNMLELAKEHGATILQTSTSEVYGEPLVHPQTEEYRGNVNPIGIRACYDEGKRCAESLFFDYNRHEGVNIKVVRIFNTYGVNMDKNDGRVVSNFINQALNGEDITIYGDGTQTRSFCYVDDTIRGLIKMMNSPKEITGPINIGNPSEFTMLELARMVLEKINSKSSVVYHPIPKDDPTRRKPCIDKAINLLNWKPEISLSEGLDKTIDYFRKEMNKGLVRAKIANER
jgi:UDP-glucuronate decarboxylase